VCKSLDAGSAAHKERGIGQDQKDNKENFCDLCDQACNCHKSENSCDNRNNEKKDGVVEHWNPFSRSVSKAFYFVLHFFLCLTNPRLNAPEQFLLLAFSEGEVVVSQLAVLLSQFTFDYVPVAFDF